MVSNFSLGWVFNERALTGVGNLGNLVALETVPSLITSGVDELRLCQHHTAMLPSVTDVDNVQGLARMLA